MVVPRSEPNKKVGITKEMWMYPPGTKQWCGCTHIKYKRVDASTCGRIHVVDASTCGRIHVVDVSTCGSIPMVDTSTCGCNPMLDTSTVHVDISTPCMWIYPHAQCGYIHRHPWPCEWTHLSAPPWPVMKYMTYESLFVREGTWMDMGQAHEEEDPRCMQARQWGRCMNGGAVHLTRASQAVGQVHEQSSTPDPCKPGSGAGT